MSLAEMEAVEVKCCAGSQRLGPVGGSAYGMPRNWRTEGAEELTKPFKRPLVVSTCRLWSVVVWVDERGAAFAKRVRYIMTGRMAMVVNGYILGIWGWSTKREARGPYKYNPSFGGLSVPL